MSDERSPARGGDRACWPVAVFRLGQQPGDDLRRSTTAEERLAMVATLTEEAWSLLDRRQPDYPRSQTPVSRRPWRSDAGSTRPR